MQRRVLIAERPKAATLLDQHGEDEHAPEAQRDAAKRGAGGAKPRQLDGLGPPKSRDALSDQRVGCYDGDQLVAVAQTMRPAPCRTTDLAHAMPLIPEAPVELISGDRLERDGCEHRAGHHAASRVVSAAGPAPR